MKSYHHIDTKDFEGYFNDFKEETYRDDQWLALAAFLLGSRFVLDSLKPKGPKNRPFLSKPYKIKDIPSSAFKSILKMIIEADHHYYFYSEKDLADVSDSSPPLRKGASRIHQLN